MAVYERTYKRYVGEVTPQWSRFLVLPRYVFKDVFKSKFLLICYVLSFVPPLIFAGRIYVANNVSTLFAAMPGAAEALGDFLQISGNSFNTLVGIQFPWTFIMALFIGPGLVSRDLGNNGLPLYLSRPLSRTEYVLGKFSVLAILLSAISWIPCLGLYLFQSGYAGWEWAVDNYRIALSFVVGFGVWICTISLLALALSAWVRWRAVAGFMMFMVFALGGFFSLIINQLFRTEMGNVLNLGVSIATIWQDLLGIGPLLDFPVWAAWFSILSFSGLCIYLLNRKVRAYEVVS